MFVRKWFFSIKNKSKKLQCFIFHIFKRQKIIGLGLAAMDEHWSVVGAKKNSNTSQKGRRCWKVKHTMRKLSAR